MKYEAKLAAEKRSTLLLKGENGIMRKKFTALNKELNEQRDELKALKEKAKEMGDVIRGLDKDILVSVASLCVYCVCVCHCDRLCVCVCAAAGPQEGDS